MENRKTDFGAGESRPGAVILLVDDDPATASMLRALFGDKQKLIIAADHDHAMALMHLHAVSVLLCSEHLKGQEGGLYFLARIRGRYPVTQLILMSESVDEDLLAFAINEVGVLKYLKKPLCDGQVIKATDEALSHYHQAAEIEQLLANYRQMAKQMRGLPYRLRQFHHGTRLLMRHGRELLLACGATMFALQMMFLGVGLLCLVILYVMKSALGINVMENLHVQDLFEG